MSTNSSVIPWKELAGMMSILMLSAISLCTEEITLTQAVWLNYQLDKIMYIHTKKEQFDELWPSWRICSRVGGVVTLIDKSELRIKNSGYTYSHTLKDMWFATCRKTLIKLRNTIFFKKCDYLQDNIWCQGRNSCEVWKVDQPCIGDAPAKTSIKERWY